MKRVIIYYILLIGMTTSLSAQLKIGYILSERIRGEYEEFKEAESQLQLEYRKVQFEFDQRVKKLDSLKQDYEVKRLMSLDKGESIKQEIEHFFNIHQHQGTIPGGVHFELTGDNVTECTGGIKNIQDDDLTEHYQTACDPRLNNEQSLEMGFLIAELLQKRRIASE